MKLYTVDTNAVIDMCYRYYPVSNFPQLWQAIENAVIARQIKLIITQHILNELQDKIKHFQYDMALFDEFRDRFQIQIIDIAEYEYTLAQLKADISTANPNLIKGLDKLDADLSNTCIMIKKGSVITSEQGLNKEIDDLSYPRTLKIPDTCRFFHVPCGNWLDVLNYIGY